MEECLKRWVKLNSASMWGTKPIIPQTIVHCRENFAVIRITVFCHYSCRKATLENDLLQIQEKTLELMVLYTYIHTHLEHNASSNKLNP
jgi:hypothetical protein